MALARLPRTLDAIRKASQSEVTNITLGQLMRETRADPASQIATARWLQSELPIRYARRIEDFLLLPHVVISNPHISSVVDTYLDTFEAVTNFPEIVSQSDEDAFCDLIKRQTHNHADGTRLIAEGYKEVRYLYEDLRLDKFLNNFFTTRIACRILMENYVVMRSPVHGSVGVVRQGMRPFALVESLAGTIMTLTRSIYGCAPEVEYRGNLDCLLDYIPRHVGYMVRELLKNALRATVERYLARSGSVDAACASGVPPVVVELQQGDVHVIIKISDQGGGMPKKVQQEAWNYGWTTVRESGHHGTGASSASKSELAGFGFGLPLTRLHAQYFGGDVFMQALPGHGTDMYLLLTHLKEGTPSTEIEDMSSILYKSENQR